MRKYNFLFCINIMAVLLFGAAGSVLADENKQFMVNSFIPEMFRDLKWQIGGGFDFDGSDYTNLSDPPETPYYSRNSNDYDNYRINITSAIEYKYETILRFFSCGLSVGSHYHNRSGEGIADRSNQSYLLYDNSYTFGDHSYGLQLYPKMEAGQYIFGDFFGKVSANYRYYYDKLSNFKRHSMNHYERIDHLDSNYRIFSWNDITNETNNRSKYNGHDIEFSLGWGRMYEGSFAATALYMIDEIKKGNYLKRDPTYYEMTSLTEIIYQYRLRHIIDSRVRRIEALDSIQSFLAINGITEEMNPRGGLIVQDVWDYFPREERYFGFKIRGGIGIQYLKSENLRETYEQTDYLDTRFHIDTVQVIDTLSFGSSEIRSSNHRETIYNKPYLIGSIQYSKPINQRVQIGGRIQGTHYFHADEKRIWQIYYYRDDYIIDYESYYVLNLAAEVDYILNSRSRFNFGATYNYLNQWQLRRDTRIHSGTNAILHHEQKAENFDIWSCVFSTRLTYRITIPTTLNFRASYSISRQNITGRYRDSNRFNLYLNLNHYIY